MKDLEEISGVTKKTIIRIEKDGHIPSVETILALSTALKTDLLKTLSPTWLENIFDMSNLSELKYMVEKMLDDNQFSNLPDILEMLNNIFDNLVDQDLSLYLYQIILFLDGIFLDTKERDFKLASENFLEALALTVRGFDINHFESFPYNYFESRILMNAALSLNKLGEFEFSKKIFLFLLKIVDKKSQIYISILHNLSIFKAREKQYKQSLTLINRAIDFSNKFRNFSKLHTSYYHRGIIEYNLGLENFRNSFELSKSLATAYGYDDFLKFLEEKMKKYI